MITALQFQSPFTLAIFHMLLTDLVLGSLLLYTFSLRFSRGLTSEYLLLFQVSLYIYRHCHYQFLYIFLSWYTLDSIIKVITSSPLPLTNNRHHYQFFYGLWHRSPHNQCHQWTFPLFVILLCRSFYLQLWIDITTAITLGNLYFILFTSPNIIPWVLISSLICHLLSTGIWIGSNLVPPVIKFRQFLLTVKSFLGSTIALMMVFPLFVFIQESKEI